MSEPTDAERAAIRNEIMGVVAAINRHLETEHFHDLFPWTVLAAGLAIAGIQVVVGAPIDGARIEECLEEFHQALIPELEIGAQVRHKLDDEDAKAAGGAL